MLVNYDNRIAPNFDKKAAVNVSLNLFISSFDSISENTMDYLITIFLRQRWNDPRLNYEAISDDDVLTLDSNMAEDIWVPDLFFTNEKTVAYTTDKLVFIWDTYTPLEINQDLELPQFALDDYRFVDCAKTYTTGSFSCLQVNFILRRDIGYYMIQTYIPSGLVVILSWVSFWINSDAVPARISLGVLTILTMTTQSTGVRQSLPRVSYIKAIDVWMSTCLVFVFASLLEFAIVNVLSRKEVKRMVTIRRTKQMKTQQDNDDLDEREVVQDGKIKKAAYLRDSVGKAKARTVDKYSRMVVSYIKAIDVWMSTCLVFVFASLLEFAIVNVLSRKEVKRMVTIRRTKQLKTQQDNDDLDETVPTWTMNNLCSITRFAILDLSKNGEFIVDKRHSDHTRSDLIPAMSHHKFAIV
ncbi:hypothetical protein LSH36_129g06010 [Paralvinella palmiformis]|uniref:Uncharacterized protein n=1 Tax=Paralvinella palmiformis TaxID=53620 RepID=A0AAD9JXD2_9ANNE|nr:hypothetical protein LSH36_129g06010 [Paralvinella palmiformis]